jgi:hypothetical protein
MLRTAASKCAWIALVASWVCVVGGGLHAEDDQACPECRRAERYQRAGYPLEVKSLATPSNTRFYGSYYVGGGSVGRSEPRFCDEGTWGWDYGGILFPKQIALGWTHGRRYQGGRGAYRTVGPTALRTQ